MPKINTSYLLHRIDFLSYLCSVLSNVGQKEKMEKKRVRDIKELENGRMVSVALGASGFDVLTFGYVVSINDDGAVAIQICDNTKGFGAFRLSKNGKSYASVRGDAYPKAGDIITTSIDRLSLDVR